MKIGTDAGASRSSIYPGNRGSPLTDFGAPVESGGSGAPVICPILLWPPGLPIPYPGSGKAGSPAFPGPALGVAGSGSNRPEVIKPVPGAPPVLPLQTTT